ncbi:hypothetical protein DPM19_33115 [Actinomadura craniellae]|uniref:DUF6745 domain-containing protein n=1 Tax=Actinomadura craniellae TaxID=2231787 RepID=A0A365GYG9_9ACTN|nr:hypothetical protein [Actinomadura craniellae]RAY10973.1 hypothetical protein DPM19_33115 [Actinomadura craniellae]
MTAVLRAPHAETTAETAGWSATAFATGPADRARAEAGVRAAYAAAGLAAPERIVWVPSPAQGAVAAALLGGGAPEAVRALPGAGLVTPEETGASVRDAVRTRPWEAARAAAYARLGPREWARAWAGTGAPLWERVNELVLRVRRGIGELAGEDAERALRGATLDAVLGQHDAPWLALFDSLGMTGDAERAGLAALAEVARTAGWWWPYERVAIISERPAELHRDEPGRLHRGDGPALAFTDGFALHAWRGMPIPADFTATLANLTAEQIGAEENAELRRVMLEHFGYDRYLAETGAQPVHRDETGVLWRINLAGDEPVVMVEVINSTPEPDGSRRTYYLRVPPNTRTARQGVAWTFGVDEADYRPEQET